MRDRPHAPWVRQPDEHSGAVVAEQLTHILSTQLLVPETFASPFVPGVVTVIKLAPAHLGG
jgi:hypothetical protein